jgi:predicted nuclease of predicted toxin-antitoxin system
MATLQEQYLLIKEGKGHKDMFMRQALRQFPNFITQSSTFKQTSTILKQKGIITENYIDLQPINNFEARPKEDFELGFENFLKEMVVQNEKEKFNQPDYVIWVYSNNQNKIISGWSYHEDAADAIADHGDRLGPLRAYGKVELKSLSLNPDNNADWGTDMPSRINNSPEKLNEAYTQSSQEINTKADSKKSSKSADEYKEKSYSKQYAAKTGDDVIFGQLIKGIQFEMDKPENEEKSLEDIKKIALKNLAKDPIYYTKNAAFGVEGIGYTNNIPGYKPSKTDKMEFIFKEKIKSNVQDSLGKKEYKKGTPKQIKQELGFIPKSSKGVKKMAMPGKEKKIKLKENFDTFEYPRTEVFSSLKDAQKTAEHISKKENNTQHVNKTPNGFRIKGGYDLDNTIASYKNGTQIASHTNESINNSTIKQIIKEELFNILEEISEGSINIDGINLK